MIRWTISVSRKTITYQTKYVGRNKVIRVIVKIQLTKKFCTGLQNGKGCLFTSLTNKIRRQTQCNRRPPFQLTSYFCQPGALTRLPFQILILTPLIRNHISIPGFRYTCKNNMATTRNMYWRFRLIEIYNLITPARFVEYFMNINTDWPKSHLTHNV